MLLRFVCVPIYLFDNAFDKRVPTHSTIAPMHNTRDLSFFSISIAARSSIVRREYERLWFILIPAHGVRYDAEIT